MLIPFVTVAPVRSDFDWSSAIDRALRASGLKAEALAALMGISAHQLSMQRNGNGHLSAQRLLMAATDADGREFLRHLLIEVSSYAGLLDLDPVAVWLTRALQDYGRMRMARAGLGNTVERKEVA